MSHSDLTIIHRPFPFLCPMAVSFHSSIHCAVALSVHFAIVFAVYLVLSQRQRRLAGVPVPQNFIHVVLGPDAEELFLIVLLEVVFVIALAFASVAAVEAAQLCSADVLKVLVDANLGETLGVLLAGLVKHLALNVDVVRPVFGLEEGGLSKAGSDGADEEGREGHQEQEHPPACLQNMNTSNRHPVDMFDSLVMQETLPGPFKIRG